MFLLSFLSFALSTEVEELNRKFKQTCFEIQCGNFSSLPVMVKVWGLLSLQQQYTVQRQVCEFLDSKYPMIRTNIKYGIRFENLKACDKGMKDKWKNAINCPKFYDFFKGNIESLVTDVKVGEKGVSYESNTVFQFYPYRMFLPNTRTIPKILCLEYFCVQFIPSEVSLFKNLEFLEATTEFPIPEEIQFLTMLNTLKLTYTRWEKKSPSYDIAQELNKICKIQNLTTLSISADVLYPGPGYTRKHEPDTIILPSVISKLTQLKNLNLWGFSSIASEITLLVGLESLFIPEFIELDTRIINSSIMGAILSGLEGCWFKKSQMSDIFNNSSPKDQQYLKIRYPQDF